MNPDQHTQNDNLVNGQSRMDIMYGQDGYLYNFNDSIPAFLATFTGELSTSATVGIFLCLCGIAFNLALVILVIGSKTLRNQHIYNQIANIALADLSFVVTVDCFSVHNDLHTWTFGVGFCKAWMILDVALPTVSIVAILLLNADRVLFMYKTKLHEMIIKRLITRVFVLLYPWCISGVLVCSLWLGFSKVEPKPEFCMYGITKEANTASTWLTLFLPAIFIVVLVVFVFIASFGDMPSETTSRRRPNSQTSGNQSAIRREEFALIECSPERSGVSVASASTNVNLSNSRQHRRMVVSILAVDFVSLLLSLPFTAFSHVSPVCNDLSSCQSVVTLFQILSWMRSSVTCFRPLLFILLTNARFVCVTERDFCCCNSRTSSSSHTYSSGSFSRARLVGGSIPRENTSSSQNNEHQELKRTSVTEGQRVPATSIHIANAVSTTITLSPPNSPNITSKNGEPLSYSAITSIPCREGGTCI